MSDQQVQHTTEELLVAIGQEMKRQTEHLSKIRTSVGFLALVVLMLVIVVLVTAAGS